MTDLAINNELMEVPILANDVPVTMPDLPLRFVISTVEQFKASSDPVRQRMLSILRSQPATAKQLADALGASPGAIGHHMRVLEEAGLVRLVARRISRGIVAKYYTRSARIFEYEVAPELLGESSIDLDILSHARNELAEAVAANPDQPDARAGFPHARLSPARVEYYQARLSELIEEMLNEPSDPTTPVYGLSLALFRSPAYMQKLPDEEGK